MEKSKRNKTLEFEERYGHLSGFAKINKMKNDGLCKRCTRKYAVCKGSFCNRPGNNKADYMCEYYNHFCTNCRTRGHVELACAEPNEDQEILKFERKITNFKKSEAYQSVLLHEKEKRPVTPSGGNNQHGRILKCKDWMDAIEARHKIIEIEQFKKVHAVGYRLYKAEPNRPSTPRPSGSYTYLYFF